MKRGGKEREEKKSGMDEGMKRGRGMRVIDEGRGKRSCGKGGG